LWTKRKRKASSDWDVCEDLAQQLVRSAEKDVAKHTEYTRENALFGFVCILGTKACDGRLLWKSPHTSQALAASIVRRACVAILIDK
jgi:hypothetical protein